MADKDFDGPRPLRQEDYSAMAEENGRLRRQVAAMLNAVKDPKKKRESFWKPTRKVRPIDLIIAAVIITGCISPPASEPRHRSENPRFFPVN